MHSGMAGVFTLTPISSQAMRKLNARVKLNGEAEAVVALFLYSLLPIIRNTHAGIRDISPAIVESAQALGLPSRARAL